MKVIQCPRCLKKDNSAFFEKKTNSSYYICYNCGKVFKLIETLWVNKDPIVTKPRKKRKVI